MRIRYAISNLIDRDLWIDTFYNVSKLQQEGLPMDTGWNSHISCTSAEWLDPKSEKTFGENAKYFKRDLAEAKKLLAAAGYASGVEVASIFPPTGYGNDLPTVYKILAGRIGTIVGLLIALGGLIDWIVR